VLPLSPGQAVALALVGIVVGLVLLVRGMRAYLEGSRVSDTATSTIVGLAAGEVRVAGTVESAEVLLVSPLQSRQCVWYRASVTESRGREGSARLLAEERAVGFRVRDASGAIRVFPRGGRFDADDALHASSGLFGETPVDLDIRHGPGVDAASILDRDAAIARLTTVQPDTGGPEPGDLSARVRGRREYREARIEPGDTVTIVGFAVPFSELADPELSDGADGGVTAAEDPEVAADLAAARSTGALAASPESAWGNAAIPGFGIGRPVRAPTLDPDADPEPLATPTEAAGTATRFDIDPDQLVLAASPDVPLLVAAGTPGVVVARESDRFLLGLAGAVLSIASAVALAVVVGGWR
jgi:hypothetical protein